MELFQKGWRPMLGYACVLFVLGLSVKVLLAPTADAASLLTILMTTFGALGSRFIERMNGRS